MNTTQMLSALAAGKLNDKLTSLYGIENLTFQTARYAAAIEKFTSIFGAEREIELFSVSGRSELSGNHTDHNHGRVVAASIDLDIIAVASKNDENRVRIHSEGFTAREVDLSAFTAPRTPIDGTSDELVAGMAVGLRNHGYLTGGFDAYTTSSVLKGSGLSSSAAFEDMIGTIFSHFYNDGRVDNVEIAKIAQYAENVFFGKPCGLMDQVACAVGGIVAIDFADPKNPVIEKLGFDLSDAGYKLCIVNTGGNHADLTADYAAVPAEMKAIAAYFGKTVLRDVDENDVVKAIPTLREQFGDRAIMRALHFYAENRRVAAQKAALEANDLDTFLENVRASGRSSFCYLQNVYTNQNPNEQGISLALCLAERLLGNEKAAWRVHGGGFAGTVQAFVPNALADEYKRTMEAAFGEGTCLALRVRPIGATKVS